MVEADGTGAGATPRLAEASVIPDNRSINMSALLAHLALHALVPLIVARLAYRRYWRRSWLIMLATMAIDVDHLLADPIYDPTRCSIGFHPLHTVIPVTLYVAALAHPRTRLVGMGLCLHIALDGLDCL